jgi:poly(A) polymerase
MSKQKPEKQKMATIAEVYNRIIWDTRLNRNLFIAGFHERVADGIREKPLAQWDDNSDIPWHRVRYIRCGETIVWDRDDRIDLISTDNLPATAWKLDRHGSSQDDLAALIDNNRAEFKPRSIYRYTGNEWKVYAGKIESIELNTLTIASYNILSDLHEVDKIDTDKRLPAILNELHQTQADIIALQEVTPTSIAFILATDWVKDYYITEAANANNVKPYGNLIMSRLPFELVEHQFSGHKRVLIGKWQINDRSIHLANVHLTSDRGENALEKRRRQLATVFGYYQQQSGDCLIVGDFNTRANEQDELIDYANFSDLWKELHPNEAGYTFDPQRNPLAMLMSLEGIPARLDRILLHRDSAFTTQISAVDLFGCEPVTDTNGKIFPSDRFGIRGVLSLGDTQSRSMPNIQNRSHLTTIRPVYESILAIIPPEDLFPQIQAIRQQYDAGFVRIVPHITLLYGFLPDEYFEEVVDSIAPILAQIQPFTVTLADFHIFTHRKTATAWLRPVVQPEGALSELQRKLNELFPQCYEQSTKTEAGFTPHLSVGQFDTSAVAQARLPKWHPVKFTVDAVALLSRRQDEPCVTRHLVSLGKYSPKATPASALTELVRQLEPELTPAERLQRETVLEIVKQACTECLGFEAALHLLGSARLGVASSNSDLDVICLIPDYVAGKRFLARVEECLQGLCDRSQVVVDARFPVLRLQIEGISIDLLYTQVEAVEGWEQLDLLALAPQIKNTKAIIGCWDADLMLDRVTERLPLATFKLLLTAVRSWAKSRGIYGNSWGFLGGFSWSILCAYSCINYRGKDFSVESLLTHFFELLNRYDWSEPLALTDAGRAYEAHIPRDLLPIVSAIEPCKNTARNVTRSTAIILQNEFARGATITKKSDWQSLYLPIDLGLDYATALTITIRQDSVGIDRPDRAELEKSLGILEACIIGLVIQLEQLNIFVRPSPLVEHCDRAGTIRLYLNLPDSCDAGKIERLASDFISQSNGLGRAAIESSSVSLCLDLLLTLGNPTSANRCVPSV